MKKQFNMIQTGPFVLKKGQKLQLLHCMWDPTICCDVRLATPESVMSQQVYFISHQRQSPKVSSPAGVWSGVNHVWKTGPTQSAAAAVFCRLMYRSLKIVLQPTSRGQCRDWSSQVPVDGRRSFWLLVPCYKYTGHNVTVPRATNILDEVEYSCLMNDDLTQIFLLILFIAWLLNSDMGLGSQWAPFVLFFFFLYAGQGDQQWK